MQACCIFPSPHGVVWNALISGGAGPGPEDVIFACGEIGLARTGLLALENAGTPEDVARVRREYPASCAAHLAPEPRVEFALALAELAERSGAAVRMGLMDLSDGLARDLPRLLDSRRTVSARISNCRMQLCTQKCCALPENRARARQGSPSGEGRITR